MSIRDSIFVIKEVGTFKFLFPVLEKLDSSLNNTILCPNEAAKYIKNFNLDIEVYDVSGKPQNEFVKLFVKKRINKIVTGAAFDEGCEKRAISASKELDIKCLSVVDHWSCFKERFSTLGKDGIDKELYYLHI